MINVLLIFTTTKNKQTIKATTTTTILNFHLRRKDKTSYNNMVKGVRKQQQHCFQETTLSHTESFHFHMFLHEQT